ncbi:MAG: hypothetical protein ACI8S6_001625 [Myxococcota bacterium]
MARLPHRIALTLGLLLPGCSGSDPGKPDGGIQPVAGELVADDADGFVVLSTTSYNLTAEARIDGDSLDGTMTWDVVEDDGSETVLCASELSLSGSALSGYCDGCDFAFAMEADIVDDGGLGDCEHYTQLSYTEDPFIINPTLVFFSEYSITYNGSVYTYTNDLRTGVALDYTQYGPDYYYPGPYYTFVAWDGSDRGTAELTDNSDGSQTLQWDWRFVGAETQSTAYTYCGGYPENFDYGTLDPSTWGGQTHSSSLDCAGRIVDLWEMELTAGDTFLATVDTVAADSAFDPFFYLNGPDSCTLGEADDSFPCTHPPLDYSCPAARFVIDEDGTYQIAVGSYGSCTGDRAEYELQLGRISK